MYQKAIDAASMVIDQKVGEYHLMTERFGWRKDVAGKDAFWDLFQMKSEDGFSNFSYQTGNKESIWVIQVDKFVQGGLNDGLATRTDQEAYSGLLFGELQNLVMTEMPVTGLAVAFLGYVLLRTSVTICGENQVRRISVMRNSISIVFIELLNQSLMVLKWMILIRFTKQV